nr:NADH dehydrogenase subunit 6 [Melanetettix sp. n. XTW-2022a]
MKMTLMKIMIMVSSYIPLMKTPMSLGMLLLMQTFLSTILLVKMLTSSWMTMIMFLMLVGGLLILFMYMSSIASNEKFKMNILMVTGMFILIMPMEELMLDNQIMESQETLTLMEKMAMSKIYNKKGMIITLFTFCYLLLTMIAVTKIVKIYKGPLRSK